jgi:(2Fe-2S) ferredoxin
MPKPERHVLVCLNQRPEDSPKGSCGARGADALCDRLRAAVHERGLGQRIMVSRTGCLKHCARGPVLCVYPEGVWYAGVRESDIAEVLERHLIGGEPVVRLLMPAEAWA